MDGPTIRGEEIPIRLYLNSFPLTPSYPNISNRLSVRHFINLVVID